MSSVITHVVTAVAMGKAFTDSPKLGRFWVISVLCACIPDADVIGFFFGIQYGDLLGHRGFSHSLMFALLLAVLVVSVGYRAVPMLSRRWFSLLIYFFVLTASHGILDAMTNGGLGVAFFSPFETSRYFLPWRPLVVSPIGIMEFFSEWGLQVMHSEILWIWLPLALLSVIVVAVRRLARRL